MSVRTRCRWSDRTTGPASAKSSEQPWRGTSPGGRRLPRAIWRRRDQAEGARGLIDVAGPARPEAALSTLQFALYDAIADGRRFVTGLEHDQWPGHDAPVRTFSRTILEREAALSTLQVALDDAIDGHGRFVLLFGEAGIGKTAVVRAFQDAARGRVRVVSGACEALFTPRPLGPVHDIADEVGGPLLDALTAQSNRAAILGALLAELKTTPTLAVLEDLHWADEATLDAIAYLGRRLDTTPCVLLATFRDDQLGPRHPLRLVIGELPSRLTVRVGLEPLSEAAVADLAREAGRSPLGLHAATGGNPFYVTEVLAADEDKIPETVRDAVLARAGRISSEGRRLLEAVAVIPGDVEIWLVERLASATISQLDECLASGVLRATSGGVEFRHELARLAVEESLTPDRRIELNRMAFRAIIDPPSGELDLAALAHHADAAGDAEAVLHYAPRAAERAAELGAHREAAAQYARALRFSASLAPDAQAELYERLSYECYLTGEFDDAIAASTQALERYRDARRWPQGRRVAASIVTAPLVDRSNTESKRPGSTGGGAARVATPRTRAGNGIRTALGAVGGLR